MINNFRHEKGVGQAPANAQAAKLAVHPCKADKFPKVIRRFGKIVLKSQLLLS